MTMQVTVIGLDQAGISFGLALASIKDKLIRIGHDPAQNHHHKSDLSGAFDKTFFRLNEAVRDADIILVSVPADQVEITFKDMAEDLKPGATVIDTSRACQAASRWAAKYLPAGVHFVSMIPTLNGNYLRETPGNSQAARDDLFARSEMIIATSKDTHEEAENLASEITTIIGAHPFFADLDKADGLLAKIDLMPKLASAGVLMATLDQPGWLDAKRIAAKAFIQTTDAIQHFNGLENPSAEILNNRENTIHALDDVISALTNLREMVASNDHKSLDALLAELKEGQAEWSDLRAAGEWDKPAQKQKDNSDGIKRNLFGNPLRNRIQ